MYRLVITKPAEKDLFSIVEYIAADNPEMAVKFHDRILSSLHNLETAPLIGALSKIKSLKAPGYRRLVIDNYIAYYLFDENKKQINIIRILHGARKQEKHF